MSLNPIREGKVSYGTLVVSHSSKKNDEKIQEIFGIVLHRCAKEPGSAVVQKGHDSIQKSKIKELGHLPQSPHSAHARVSRLHRNKRHSLGIEAPFLGSAFFSRRKTDIRIPSEGN